ncbi:hypothetical protein [Tardiphaga robiniae]|uniref:hypothetical protein n=1 Tax=Tardiphaga robiniae TaxID=943830 RepID=UPI001112A287|nr:hypothetical protein [Tardiphaga robiniae]
MGKSAENERLKLRATFLNNAALAVLVAGVVAPAFYVMSEPSLRDLPVVTAFSTGGFWPAVKSVSAATFAAFGLHCWASALVSRIED